MNLCFLLITILLVLSGIIRLIQVRVHKETTLYALDKNATMPLRGILACLIILTHVSFFYSQDSYVWNFTSFGAQAVSVFFFLSGYGLIKSIFSKGKTYLYGFLQRSLKKLLTPFLIASTLWIGIECIFLNGDIYDLLYDFIIWKPPLPYSWFIYALVVQYVSFFLCFRLLCRFGTPLKLIIMSCLTLAQIITYRILNFEVFWYISLFAFNIGSFFAIGGELVRKALMKHPMICTISIAAILYILAVLLQTRTTYLAVMPIGVVLPFILLGSPKSRFLNFLGNISYEIYLAHGITVTLLSMAKLDFLLFLIYAETLSITLAFGINEFERIVFWTLGKKTSSKPA